MSAEIVGVLPYAVNFSILVIALVFFTRKPFQRFVFQRHERIKDAVLSADKDKRLASDRMDAVARALKTFNEDAEKIRNDERHAGVLESAAIAERSKQELARISAESIRIIENESRERELLVRRKFVDLVAKDAEGKLSKNLKRDDHGGLIKRAGAHIEVSV